MGGQVVEQLGSYLRFLLIDKAKIGSDILRRIQKVENHGGIRMYAEVYKWFTETSGLGLMEQASRLMAPKRAAKEELVADAIEFWEEKVNRLARFGEEFQLNEAFKKAALKKILTGKVLDNFELWQTEKLSFDELLKRVKEQARAHKLDADVSTGRSGIATGSKKTLGPTSDGGPGLEEPKVEGQSRPTQEEAATDLNAFGQRNR